jgi:MFS family permease
MLRKFTTLYNTYPAQFWLMVFGVCLSTAGASMIGPYLMIYASGKLGLPLSTVVTLITINAWTGLVSSFIAGTLADKIGRKVVMVISLLMNGLIYLFMMRAETYTAFAVLMFLSGLANPLYQVGADAMLADLIPQEKRTDAYAINRMMNNAGFAVGPAVGGFIAALSYDYAFYGAAAGMIIYSLLLFFLARETLGSTQEKVAEQTVDEGYARVFRDKGYLSFVALVGGGLIAPGMVWTLLAVYTKINFGLPESQYGWIPTTNALMCVLVQYFVTLVARRHPPLPVAAVGMFIYALGVGSVALMGGFWGFWLSMVILTFGELTLIPTATTYVANIAPPDLRGRYMSVYWLCWGLSRGAAPLLGGWLNDRVSPRSIWIAGLLIGLTSTCGLALMARLQSKPSLATAQARQMAR